MRATINSDDALNEGPGKSGEQLNKTGSYRDDDISQDAAARLEPKDTVKMVE